MAGRRGRGARSLSGPQSAGRARAGPGAGGGPPHPAPHAPRLDPARRDEVISRIRALGVPSRVLGLSPVIAAVLADGKVMDATLEPVRDLDARILADWSSF